MLDVVLSYVEVFTLVLVRISSFILVAPIFGAKHIPAMVKSGLILFLTILITPVIAATDAGAAYAGMPFAHLFLVLIKEFMVGVTLAMVALFIYAAVQIGGMFIDMQIGFAMANVFDPQTGASTPLTGQFKYVLATLLFLGFDGHHGLLTALMQSYSFFPIGGFQLTDNLASLLMETFVLMFVLGIKIAIPVVAALFLTDVGLAILSKTVPQMNVFVIGMPLKIIVGGLMLVVAMPAMVYFLQEMFRKLFTQMDSLLRVLGG